MKNKLILTIAALGFALPAVNLNAQTNEAERPEHLERRETPERRERPERMEPPERRERMERRERFHRPGQPEGMRGRGPAERPHRPIQMREGARPGGERPMIAPLFGALDSNHDGVIDRREIRQARHSLRKLDRNHDGEITPPELRPLGIGPRVEQFRGEPREEERHQHRGENRGPEPRVEGREHRRDHRR